MKKIIIALLPFIVLTAKAQEEEKPSQKVEKFPKVSVRKKKKIAETLVKQGSYYNASEYYEDVLKAKPDNIKVVHQLAEINRSLRDYKLAEKYYALEIEKDKDKWPNDMFFLGQMQKMNGKYDDAKNEWIRGLSPYERN